ncbi:DGK1 [Sanghuangporus sanghuang]
MNVPANDAISLNSRSHRRRSITRSPPAKISFFATSSAQQQRHGARKHPMSLRRRPASNSSASISGFSANGVAHDLSEEKPKPTVPVKRDGTKPNGHASPPIDWEIPRKLLHSSIGFLVVYLYKAHVSASTVAVVLSGACTLIASVDFVRLRSRQFAAVYEKIVGFLMRESEKDKINGVIWYLLGCIFVLKFYPEDIATVSILTLSWCDTAASVFGRMYGSRTSRLPQSISIPLTTIRLPSPFAKRKSVAGFLAGSITGAFIVFGFWRWLAPFGAQPSSLPEVIRADSQSLASLAGFSCIALVSGLLAGFAEAIDIGSLDDNLTLPIVAGGLIWALFKLVEYIF